MASIQHHGDARSGIAIMLLPQRATAGSQRHSLDTQPSSQPGLQWFFVQSMHTSSWNGKHSHWQVVPVALAHASAQWHGHARSQRQAADSLAAKVSICGVAQGTVPQGYSGSSTWLELAAWHVRGSCQWPSASLPVVAEWWRWRAH